MADLSRDELAELLDEKLRPIKSRLDEHSRLLNERAERPQPHLRMPLTIGSLLLGVVLIVVAGRALLTRVDPAAGRPAGQAAPGSLLYADEFANPAKGLFLQSQQGTALLPADRATARWDYAYQNGELVAHVGPPSQPLAGRVAGGAAKALTSLTGDFAVEVNARASGAAASALYGLRFYPGGREFGFGVIPASQTWQLWEIFRPPLLSRTSDRVASGDADNQLRLEVRGSAIRLLANGQLLDTASDEAFGARPAAVGLFFDSTADPGGPTVEVRYTDFRVYRL